MTKLSNFWQKLVIWFTAYVNVIAFILAGGYLYLKSEDEDARSSAKLALFVYAGFTALEMLRALIYNMLNLFGAGYETLSVLSDISTAIAIVRIICFATLFILDLCGTLTTLKGKIAAIGASSAPSAADADDESDDN